MDVVLQDREESIGEGRMLTTGITRRRLRGEDAACLRLSPVVSVIKCNHFV